MPERYLRQNDRAAWRVYDGEAVIVSPDDSMLHTLNPAGTIVWEAADGVTPWREIVARVADTFGADAGRVEPDVLGFVAELEARGLASWGEVASPASLDLHVASTMPGTVHPPYEPPRVLSEAVFETTALACGKLPAGGGKCNSRPKNS
jgi:coenzyme PQQ synthesis protein D (PqqD)